MVKLFQYEADYVANVAVLDSAKTLGVTQYIFVATIDERTSSKCASLHGKIFKLEDLNEENIPPLHPNCRNTLVPLDTKDYYENGGTKNYNKWLEDYLDRNFKNKNTLHIASKTEPETILSNNAVIFADYKLSSNTAKVTQETLNPIVKKNILYNPELIHNPNSALKFISSDTNIKPLDNKSNSAISTLTSKTNNKSDAKNAFGLDKYVVYTTFDGTKLHVAQSNVKLLKSLETLVFALKQEGANKNLYLKLAKEKIEELAVIIIGEQPEIDSLLSTIGSSKVKYSELLEIAEKTLELVKKYASASPYGILENTSESLERVEYTLKQVLLFMSFYPDGVNFRRWLDNYNEPFNAEKFKNIEKLTKTINNNLDKLTKSEIESITKYTGDNYVNINNSLRGLDKMTDSNKIIDENLSSALDKASLPNDVVVYRGTSTEALGDLNGLSPKELIGKTFVEPAYMSTSTDSTVALETFSGNVQMTIKAPKGAKGLDVSLVSQFANESEILFQSGQVMQIQAAEIINDILHIIVKIIK